MDSVESVDGQARWRTRVTILIGVASLLGALATWRLTTVAGEAGGADARAVEDTITRQQNRSSALVTARAEATAFGRLRGYERAATSLEALADSSEARGDDATAQDLRATGQTLREAAIDLLDRYGALRDPRYVGKEGKHFRVSRRRADLELNIERASRKFPAPDAAAAAATAAHGHAGDIGLVILGFAFAIFLFALSEKLRDEFDSRLAIAGAAVLAAATVMLLVAW